MKKRKGKLIAVSGLDGCGKSTLVLKIAQYLTDRGIKNVVNSAISDASTTIGRQIGDILRDPQTECPLPPNAEHALMIAARVLAERNVIRPAIDRGDWVVSDRYSLCGLVYQKNDMGGFLSERTYWSRLSMFGLNRSPDLEIILDIDPLRPHKEHDKDNRLEVRTDDDWKRMRGMYRHLAIKNTGVMLLDGSSPIDNVFEKAQVYIDRLIDDSKL